ncbi:putative membrane protein insertion efficiency factor [Enhygromyxa salina]|uniref:Putative membrane protein insertion efficiency factor n=1 Tax=Enhygromyxa salina TaxID=215803 RepID=A0A2S9XRF6_9BACT|nr:putative membrane protein insertion efficiency factor [Enhygromyxa salina]
MSKGFTASSWLVQLPSRLAVAVIRVYQLILSPMLGPTCRFSPSCSHYACACLRDHGLLRGSWLTVRRLSRCHPWHPGGHDPPPLARGAGPASAASMTPLGPAERDRVETRA